MGDEQVQTGAVPLPVNSFGSIVLAPKPMKQPIFLMLACAMMFAACGKEDNNEGLPECLHDRISEFANSNIVRIEEYWFQERKVYKQVIASNCYDCPITVVDADCRIVCSCCGFSGIPEGPVVEFQHAPFLRVVWQQ